MVENCKHEYGPWIKTYGIPSGYEETIYTDEVKIVGPQMYARRICTKCNKEQILVGSKVENILAEEEQKNAKKL